MYIPASRGVVGLGVGFCRRSLMVVDVFVAILMLDLFRLELIVVVMEFVGSVMRLVSISCLLFGLVLDAWILCAFLLALWMKCCG